MVIISMVSGKGGVTKTTSTTNIGVFLAKMGYKTLLLDLDKQSHTTKYFDMYDPSYPTIANVMLDKISPIEVIKNTGIENLDLIPATYSALEEAPDKINLDFNRSRTNRLKEIEKLDYDFVIIDNPPDLGLLVTNTLSISDYILVPIIADKWGVEGLENIVNKMEVVRDEHNSKLKLLGVFLSMDNSRTTLSQAIKEQMKNMFKDKFFNTAIRRSADIGKSTYSGYPIAAVDVNSAVSQDYKNLTMEVVEKCKM